MRRTTGFRRSVVLAQGRAFLGGARERVGFCLGETSSTGRFFGTFIAAGLRSRGIKTSTIACPPAVSIVPSGSELRRLCRCDAVVMIRPAFPGVRDFIGELMEHDVTVIHLVDDWLFAEASRFDLYGGAVAVNELLASYDDVDGFIASTQALAENLDIFGKPVWVQRIGLWDLGWRSRQYADATVRIGWTGSGSRRIRDLELLAEPLTAILDCHRSVRFVAIGDHETLGILGIANHPRVSSRAWAPIGKYSQLLSDIDIGLGPVYRCEVNRCKTGIKALEYIAAGAVPVVSGWQPEYATIVNDGIDGVLVGDVQDEWFARLDELVSDSRRRDQMRLAALSKAKSQRMQIGDPGTVPPAYDAILRGYRHSGDTK